MRSGPEAQRQPIRRHALVIRLEMKGERSNGLYDTCDAGTYNQLRRFQESVCFCKDYGGT